MQPMAVEKKKPFLHFVRIPKDSPVPSLLGMARWQPIINGKKVQKGGIGTYHMEYDYNNVPEYKWLRQGIQIMNPSK